MNKEIWKDIPDYEGLYQASTYGRIKSLPRKTWNRFQYVEKPEKILTPRYNSKGYVAYALFKNGVRKDFKGHWLILYTFNPIDNKTLQINHENGIKDDNRLSNLTWATGSENMKHSYRMGLHKPMLGKNNPGAKPVYQYSLDGKFIKRWDSLADACRYYNKIIHVEREKSIGFVWKKEKI